MYRGQNSTAFSLQYMQVFYKLLELKTYIQTRQLKGWQQEWSLKNAVETKFLLAELAPNWAQKSSKFISVCSQHHDQIFTALTKFTI